MISQSLTLLNVFSRNCKKSEAFISPHRKWFRANLKSRINWILILLDSKDSQSSSCSSYTAGVVIDKNLF